MMTGSFGWIARSPCPAGTYGERPLPGRGEVGVGGDGRVGAGDHAPEARILVEGAHPVDGAVPAADRLALEHPLEGHLRDAGADLFPGAGEERGELLPVFPERVGFVGRFRGADLPDDRGDVLGLRAGEDLLEAEEGPHGEDVQFESDGAGR